MPITIVDSPEPLSFTSRKNDCILAESDASILLKKELRLYCDRGITGRSFLIAGHRGSGKTTLVQNAFLQIWKEKKGEDSLIPLLVPLNGPSLLPREEDKSREPVHQHSQKPAVPAHPAQAVRPPDEAKDRPKSTPQIALEQITLGIYQALAQELSFHFRKRALASDPAQRREQLELAAQLEVELYEYPEPARLREIWERAEVLETGVLDVPAAHPDQGLRELVALTGACEAYRRISGTFTQTDTLTTEGSAKSQMSVALESSKELFSSLASLLAGGLVGAGIFAADHSAVPAALTGLATALGAAMVFKVSDTRTRDRTGKRESNFVLDTSVPTLERVLPILISRLRDARLTPIFLVDELDKVENLPVRMKELVPQLKKFVSESTFFCFLVDRDYFETVKRLWDGASFPVEYTYFTHQLYIVLRAEDLHDYLGKILKAPQVELAAGEPLEGEAADARKLAESKAREQISESTADYPVLPYILLHRSRMHPVDLRRELALLRDSENNVKLLPGRVRSAPAFRVDLILQIAIEMVLDEDRLAQELECHPVFRRLAYDALYYLSWMWQKEKDPDLGDDNRGEFESYLSVRMGRDKKEFQLPENDLRFLYDKVRQVAELVSDLQRSYPAALAHWKERRLKRGTTPLAAEVEAALALELSPPAPLERQIGDWRFRWRVDASGLSLYEEPDDQENLLPSDSSPEPVVWDNVDLIEDLSKGLGLQQGNGDAGRISFTKLTSELHILSTTPAWSETERAIARLRQVKENWRPYPEFPQDRDCVGAFADMLRRSDRLLADALFSGAVLGTASAVQNPGERLVLGLLEISNLHRLEGLQEKESGERLDTLAKALRNEVGLSSVESLSLSQGTEAWLAEVRNLLTDAEKSDLLKTKALAERRRAAWAVWRARLAPYALGPRTEFPAPPIPTVDDLVCAVSNVSPASLLKPHLGEMTLVGWSEVLYWALADVPPDVSCYMPIWMVYPALLALGFPPGSWAPLVDALVADEITYNKRPIQEEISTLKEWDSRPPALQAAPSPRLLILRKSQGSALMDWKPSPRGAAIVLDISIAARLERSFPLPIASLESFVPIDRIAIEIGAGDGAVPTQRALERIAKARDRQLPRPSLQFRTEPGEEKNVARSLDELLALAALPDPS